MKLKTVKNFFGKNKVEIYIFLLAFIVYGYFITGFHSANESSALALIKAIVEDHSLAINNFKDLASVDVSLYNGNYYSDKPPGRAIFGIPVYILDKFFGFTSEQQVYFSMEIITVMISALSVVLIYRFAIFLKIHKNTALILAIIYGFATISWAFSRTFFAHPYSAFFNLLALYTLLLALKKNERKYLIYSGISMGISFLMEYTNFFVIIVFGAYYLYRNRLKNIPNIFILGISFLAVVSILLVYDYSIFGNPLITTESYQLSYGNIVQTQLFKTSELRNGLNGLLFSNTGGLFYFSPILLLSVFGLFQWIREDINNKKIEYRYLSLILLLSFVSVLLFYAAKEGWRGGNSFGPRYLLPVIPFLLIPLGKAVQQNSKNKLFWIVFSIFFVYSIFVALLGGVNDPTPAEIFQDPIYDHNLPILLNGQLDSYLYGQNRSTLTVLVLVVFVLLYLLLKDFIKKRKN